MIRAFLSSLALLLCAATSAGAQADHGEKRPTSPTGAAPGECAAGVISTISIDNHSIFDTSNPDQARGLRLAYRIANALHPRTRASVIRRDLPLRPGACFDAGVIAESERLLRDNQFLAFARIRHRQREDGDYDLVVETRDEWSMQLDLRATLDGGLSLYGGSLRESNFLGTGQIIELFYLDRDANHNYGLGYHTHQLAGSRWHLGATLGRTHNGPLLFLTLSYPFREEAGRWAARQEFRQLDRYFDYLVDDEGTERHLLLATDTRAIDLAVIHRLGRPGNQITLGAALGYARITFPDGVAGIQLIDGDDFDDPQPADSLLVRPLLRQMTPLRTLRGLLLLGQRRINWTKRHGFDTLRGAQDIRLGTELGLAVGRSLTAETGPHHLYTALDLYAAAGTEDLLLTGQMRGDAQHHLGLRGDGGWNDIFGAAELLAYWKPNSSVLHTLLLRAAATGGWEMRAPFQLTLGGDLGVRGYPPERFAGGRSILLSLEDRLTFNGPFREIMDLGATAFLDLGRTWPGDAPYGRDSGWRAAAGVGLRNAFPSGGRRTYRVDLAMPIQPDLHLRDLRLILSVGELIGISPNVQRARIDERRRFATRNPFYFPD
jgi:hypothetical protein